MKYFSYIALIASVSAYATAEGPTKVDYGEADETVLPRADRATSGWVNPLSVTDSGANDDWVVLQFGDTSLFQMANKAKGVREIYDADGDGVEDNDELTPDELDRYYIPNAFSPDIDDIHNSRHGNMPGMRRKSQVMKAPVFRPEYDELDWKHINFAQRQHAHRQQERRNYYAQENRNGDLRLRI